MSIPLLAGSQDSGTDRQANPQDSGGRRLTALMITRNLQDALGMVIVL